MAIRFSRTTRPWFTVVEIEMNSLCNQRCTYCPVSILPVPDVPKNMSDDVFNKLLDELCQIDFSGKISYHFYNEPLLRHDLEKYIAQVKDTLPNAFQLLFTNGTLLTEERYNNLLKAGIDHFLVTRHDFAPMPERPRQTVEFPNDLIVSNRGGTMYQLKEPLNLPCFVPNESLIVTVTGEILLCCDDAQRKIIMGDLKKQSIEEIWFSDKFIEIRELLKKGRRDTASSICRHCSNKEYFVPGKA